MSAPVSRRTLCGAPAGLLVLAAQAAGSAAASPSRDAELVAFADELATIHQNVQASNDGDENESWPEFDALLDDFWRVADRIELLRAKTLEGVQAKARAVRCVVECVGWDASCPTARHTAGLLRDMVGEI